MTNLEKTFSKKVLSTNAVSRVKATRIETRSTTVGVPDIFVACEVFASWIELKVSQKPIDKSKPYHKVMWRPGQQAFMLGYTKSTGQYCYTVIGCAASNDIYVICNDRLFNDNNVPIECINT